MKDIFSLHNAPLWFLGALAVVAGVLVGVPSLGETLPMSVRPYRVLALLVLSVLFLAAVFGWLANAWSARRRRALDRDRQRLERVYAPLTGLFVDRHVVMSSVILAPRLRDRMPAVGRALRTGRWHQRMFGALKALHDSRTSTSSEIEFGRDFPLSDIKALVQAEAAIVDQRLRNLVRQADYSSYEPPTSGVLSAEEQALFVYIQEQCGGLERRIKRDF